MGGGEGEGGGGEGEGGGGRGRGEGGGGRGEGGGGRGEGGGGRGEGGGGRGEGGGGRGEGGGRRGEGGTKEWRKIDDYALLIRVLNCLQWYAHLYSDVGNTPINHSFLHMARVFHTQYLYHIHAMIWYDVTYVRNVQA